MSNTLDFGVRSKCCLAPIRFGTKENKKTKQRKKIFICCKCRSRDVDIIDVKDIDSQDKKTPLFVEDYRL